MVRLVLLLDSSISFLLLPHTLSLCRSFCFQPRHAFFLHTPCKFCFVGSPIVRHMESMHSYLCQKQRNSHLHFLELHDIPWRESHSRSVSIPVLDLTYYCLAGLGSLPLCCWPPWEQTSTYVLPEREWRRERNISYTWPLPCALILILDSSKFLLTVVGSSKCIQARNITLMDVLLYKSKYWSGECFPIKVYSLANFS